MSDHGDEEVIAASRKLSADEPGSSTRAQFFKRKITSDSDPKISLSELLQEQNLEQLKQLQKQLEHLRLKQQQLQLSAQTDEPPHAAGTSSGYKSLPSRLLRRFNRLRSFSKSRPSRRSLNLSTSTSTRGEPTAGGSGSTGEQVHRPLSPLSAANAKLAKLQEGAEQLQLKWKQMRQEQLQHLERKDEPPHAAGTSVNKPPSSIPPGETQLSFVSTGGVSTNLWTSTRGEPTAGGSGSTGEQVHPPVRQILWADPNPHDTFEVKHREKLKQLQLEDEQLQWEIWDLQEEMSDLQIQQETLEDRRSSLNQFQHLEIEDEPPDTAVTGIRKPTPPPIASVEGPLNITYSGLSLIPWRNKQGEPTAGGSGLTVHPPASPTSVADPKVHESYLVSMSERLQEQQRQPREEEQQQLQHLEGEDAPSHFTPEVFKDHGSISYRYRGPGPGVFQCDMTKLAFRMTRAGELTYRVVWWDVEMLHTAGKAPAGLLFDIKCPEDAVSQLHLPHCETDLAPLSEGLSVVHISDDDGVSILKPQGITDTHVIVDVPHLSAFGLVWDVLLKLLNIGKPISGQVLLFHQPPYAERSQKLYVFLLPENVPKQEVKGQLEEAEHIVAPSSCHLIRNQTYSVDCPQASLVQPECAVYDFNYGPNYHPTFEIRLKAGKKLAVVKVQDQENRCIWDYYTELTGLKPASSSASLSSQPPPSEPARPLVLLEEGCSASSLVALSKLPPAHEPASSTGGRRGRGPDPCGQSLPRRGKYEEKLFSVRTEFIARVSTSVLKDLMDALLQNKVINDRERESIPAVARADKAQELIDMVIRKGDPACRLLIETFCKVDPFVSEQLKLN